jgi:hypothetical protein
MSSSFSEMYSFASLLTFHSAQIIAGATPAVTRSLGGLRDLSNGRLQR